VRYPIVLSFACLMLFVTRAGAEDAWILWLNGKARIAPFASFSRCMEEAKWKITNVPAVPGHTPESSGASWSVLALLLGGGTSMVRYDCLPETLDPRELGPA